MAQTNVIMKFTVSTADVMDNLVLALRTLKLKRGLEDLPSWIMFKGIDSLCWDDGTYAFYWVFSDPSLTHISNPDVTLLNDNPVVFHPPKNWEVA